MTVTADDASHPMPNAIYVDPVTHVGTQEAVTLTWTANGSGGGTLTGTSLHYPAGTPVFTLTVDASGNYVFTENAPLAHPITGTEDNLQLVFSYTVTDGDNDTASSTLTINIDDDTPTFTHIANAIIANEDNNIVVGLHDFAFGADGEQSIEVTPLTPISGLTYLTPVHNADGSVDLKAQVSGADFFDLRINPDGTYTFDLIESRPTTTQTFDFSGLAGGQGTTQFTLGDATFHSVGEILKPTSNGFGVGDGNLDSGDAFSITFTGGTDKLSFFVEHEAGAPFTMSWATNTGEAGTVSTLVDGLLTVDPTVDFTSITFDVTGGKAKFDNFSYTTPVLPADQTLQFSIYGVDGDGDQSGTQTLSVTMLGTKAANTPTNGTSSDEAIKGTSSADTLNGSDGNDVLEGGAGNDTLSGGNGADLFVLDGHSAALNVGAGGTDIIQDFQSGLDQILVDVVNLSFPLSSAQPVGSQFNFGGDINIDPAAWSGGGTDRFYYDTTTHDLWYSASGTGADKIDLAHMATGVTPAEMQGGLKIF